LNSEDDTLGKGVFMVSPHHHSTLPHIQPLIRLSQSLALLDALLEPEWQYRYYSFNAHWNDAEMMASLRNGSGDGYFIWFGQPGAAIKGFAHESAVWNSLGGQQDLALSNLSRQIPTEFEPFLREPFPRQQALCDQGCLGSHFAFHHLLAEVSSRIPSVMESFLCQDY
jgi:hypothetical protein